MYWTYQVTWHSSLWPEYICHIPAHHPTLPITPTSSLQHEGDISYLKTFYRNNDISYLKRHFIKITWSWRDEMISRKWIQVCYIDNIGLNKTRDFASCAVNVAKLSHILSRFGAPLRRHPHPSQSYCFSKVGAYV